MSASSFARSPLPHVRSKRSLVLCSTALAWLLSGCGGRSQSGAHVNPWADEADASPAGQQEGGVLLTGDAGTPPNTDPDPTDDTDPAPTLTGTGTTTTPTTTPTTTTAPTTEPTTEPDPTTSGTLTPVPTDSATGGGGSTNPPPTASTGAGGDGPIGTGGGGSVGGSGPSGGGPSTGGSGPGPMIDGGSGNCEPTRYSYSDSCELYYDNCGQYKSSSCWFGNDGWTCSCSGQNAYYPSIAIDGTADSATTCELAVSLCEDTPTLVGDVQCEDAGFSSQSDYCETRVTCGQQFDLGDSSATAFNYQDNYARCSQYSDNWECYCEYPTYGVYTYFNLGDTDSAAACQGAQALCEGQVDPEPPTSETCDDFVGGSSATNCDASRSCLQAVAVEGGSVEVVVNEYTSCQLRNDEWMCSCAGDRMPEMRAVANESIESDVVCEQVGELCNDAQWLTPSGEISCETTQVDVRPNNSCSVNLSCGQALPVEGATISTLAPAWLNCYNYDDVTWECSCSDNNQSLPLALTPGDDLWTSCTDLAAECVQALDLDFRR